jgi:hypothetical protein
MELRFLFYRTLSICFWEDIKSTLLEGHHLMPKRSLQGSCFYRPPLSLESPCLPLLCSSTLVSTCADIYCVEGSHSNLSSNPYIDNSIFYFIFLLFWVLLVVGALRMLVQFGHDFVDHPRLVGSKVLPVQTIMEKTSIVNHIN